MVALICSSVKPHHKPHRRSAFSYFLATFRLSAALVSFSSIIHVQSGVGGIFHPVRHLFNLVMEKLKPLSEHSTGERERRGHRLKV